MTKEHNGPRPELIAINPPEDGDVILDLGVTPHTDVQEFLQTVGPEKRILLEGEDLTLVPVADVGLVWTVSDFYKPPVEVWQKLNVPVKKTKPTAESLSDPESV